MTAIVLQAQLLSARDVTEQQLIQGLDSGESLPLTPADWESLKRRVWERDAAKQANQSPCVVRRHQAASLSRPE